MWFKIYEIRSRQAEWQIVLSSAVQNVKPRTVLTESSSQGLKSDTVGLKIDLTLTYNL